MRNIVNKDEIIDNLEGLYLRHPKLESWINSKLKNYIIRKESVEIVNLGNLKTIPEWYQEGMELHKVIYNKDLYLKMIKGLEFNPSWENHSIEHLISLVNNIELYVGSYYWTNLKSSSELKKEGEAMNHCVGTYGNKVSSGQSTIYSLRDKNNQSVCTVELRKGKLSQVVGEKNSTHRARDYKAIIKLAEAINADIEDIKPTLNPPFILLLASSMSFGLAYTTSGFISGFFIFTGIVLLFRYLSLFSDNS